METLVPGHKELPLIKEGLSIMDIKNAIIISAAIHLGAIAPLCTSLGPSERPKKDMVVDYLILKDPVKDREVIIPEKPKIELRPKVDVVSEKREKQADADPKPKASQDPADRQASGGRLADTPANRERIMKTRDYINYYQLLREKIRQKVRRNYRSSYSEGEVQMSFRLRSDGSIISVNVERALSTNNRPLIDMAIRSLNAASPFPSFPKDLALPEMTFSITIVFKKDR